MGSQQSAAPSEEPPHQGATDDATWHVWTRAGVVPMTLDELDQAFQRGEVDAKTRVFTSGMSAWDTLGALANLDDPGGEGECCRAAELPTPAGESAEVQLEVIEGGSFPPLTVGAGVQPGPGRMPFPRRRAAAHRAGGVPSLKPARRRLAVIGLCALGAALSAVFVFSRDHVGAALTKPVARAEVPSISRLSAPIQSPGRAAAGQTSRPLAAAAPSSVDDDESIAVVRATQLRLAPPPLARARSARARSARTAHDSRAALKARASAHATTRKKATRRRWSATAE